MQRALWLQNGTTTALWFAPRFSLKYLLNARPRAKRVGPCATAGPRRVEDAERQNVCLPEQIRYWTGGKLCLELIIAEPRGVANAIFQSIGPSIISSTLLGVSVWDKWYWRR